MPQYPSNITSALSDSASDFIEIVWPAISPHIGGGRLLPVEAVSPEDFASELDLMAGIDAWQIVKNNQGMRGIASRVQWGSNYQSFSIRYSTPTGAETEYQKRLRAIKNPNEGYLSPHMTIQAFLDSKKGELLAVAAIPTRHLIEQAERLIGWGQIKGGEDSRYGIRKSPDGREFIYLSWQYINNSQIKDHLIWLIKN
ncbi:hypothetical protein [Paracidovorax avenae]|nr:hypothetical protein [Paracidovorax avenae]